MSDADLRGVPADATATANAAGTSADNTPAILRMLGLAKRARKIAVGTDAVIDAVRSANRPSTVIAASDASDRTKKQLADKCAYHKVALVIMEADRQTLAAALGIKDGQCSACAVTDRNMAKKIDLLINT